MKILILSPVDSTSERTLREAHDVCSHLNTTAEQLPQLIADREVVIFRSGVTLDRSILAAATRLRAVIRAGAGLDNIDLECLERRGIALHRIPGPAAQAVAELAFGQMLALARRLLEAHASLSAGRWEKAELSGRLLYGKTLGIVGAGNIGSRVGEMGATWGMQVLGCVEAACEEDRVRLAARGIQLTSFDDVIRRADFLSVHVPLVAETRNLINADVFSRMKQGAFLVNSSRGSVVHEEDLVAALGDQGPLAGAAMDVHAREGAPFHSPLVGMPNVLLTPHIGSTTVDTQREIGKQIIRLVAQIERETQLDDPPRSPSADALSSTGR